MTANERVKEIRDFHKLNQTDFGKKINISRSQVAAIENNLRALTDRTINDICREFNINEHWLRTGEDDMSISNYSFTLDEYAKQRKATPLEIEILKGFLDLDEDLREAILNHFKVIFLKHAETATTKESLSPDEIDKSDEIVKGLKDAH